jgi:branched-chain amino acid transport system permease protein
MRLVWFQLLNGFVWGWVVALMALGLNLVYGVLRIINVAHGAFYMLGAVLGWVILTHLGSVSSFYALNFALALLLAPLLVALFGGLVEWSVLRPIERQPVLTIIATFALLLILQQGVQLVLPTTQQVAPPVVGGVEIFGLRYPLYRGVLAALSAFFLLVLWLLLYQTRFGLWSRAVRQDPELALALGIPVPRVYGMTFGLGVALAAVAGVLTAPIVPVEATMGMDILLDSFIVVIVGGLGSLQGAVIAALLFQMAKGLFTVWMSPVTAHALSLLLMGALLLIRPHGLFAKGAD